MFLKNCNKINKKKRHKNKKKNWNNFLSIENKNKMIIWILNIKYYLFTNNIMISILQKSFFYAWYNHTKHKYNQFFIL